MEKKLKRKCVISGMLIIIGVVMYVLALRLEGLTEMQTSYMSGFGMSLGVASFVLLIKNISAMRNPNALRKREIELTDERSIEISNKSMAITFRICILIEALGSMVLALMNNELGLYLGAVVGIQLIVYVISSVVLSKKL